MQRYKIFLVRQHFFLGAIAEMQKMLKYLQMSADATIFVQ